MARFRTAVATARFAQPLRQAVRTVSAMEAGGVQFDARTQLKPTELSDTGRRQLLHTLDELRLSVASLTLPLRHPLHEVEYLEVRLVAIKEAMEFAWSLKSRVLTCRIGRIIEEADSPAAVRQRELLRDLARHGNHIGVTFTITPSGDSPAVLAALIDEIDAGPLGIDFDPAERVMSRLDPIQSLRDLHAHVTHITIRDALRDMDGSGREAVVGRGEVDWDEIVATIDEMNYTGWLSVDRHDGNDPIGDATRAVAYLKGITHSE